jgi:hypothetical protein
LNSFEEVTTPDIPQVFESFVTINPDDSRILMSQPLNTLLEDDDYDSAKQLLIPSYQNHL